MNLGSLKKQLEVARFDRAMEVTESLAEHRALLTTVELARINQIVTGKAKEDVTSPKIGGQSESPWRTQAVTLTLPSGKLETLDLIVDPVLTAREKLHRATETAEAGHPVDAAIQIYTSLILAHVFVDANRRTAALAAHYFFHRYDVPLSGDLIHNLEVGDLRQPAQIESLKNTILEMLRFSENS